MTTVQATVLTLITAVLVCIAHPPRAWKLDAVDVTPLLSPPSVETYVHVVLPISVGLRDDNWNSYVHVHVHVHY